MFQSVVGLIFVFATDKFAKTYGRGRYNIMKRKATDVLADVFIYVFMAVLSAFVSYTVYTRSFLFQSAVMVRYVKSSVPLFLRTSILTHIRRFSVMRQ